MDGSERYEQLIAFLGAQLPQPVEEQTGADGGELVFTGGEPVEVVVYLTGTSVIVAEFAGRWESPCRFVPRPRKVGTLRWRRLPETVLQQALSALIKGARERRLATYQTCQSCGKHRPPEWLHGDAVCRACAEQCGGMIH
jgi:hypothetical protein